MLVIANKKRSSQNIKYVYMDATKLELDQKFDVIASRTVFHHFADISAVINKLKPLLNEQGKLIILDVTSEKETPNAAGYIIGAVKDFVPDCQKYGLNNAIRFFRFKTSRHWLRHVTLDKYLSEKQFKNLYDGLLPNCSFMKVECFMGIVWAK